jgi:hypothetical protein
MRITTTLNMTMTMLDMTITMTSSRVPCATIPPGARIW